MLRRNNSNKLGLYFCNTVTIFSPFKVFLLAASFFQFEFSFRYFYIDIYFIYFTGKKASNKIEKENSIFSLFIQKHQIHQKIYWTSQSAHGQSDLQKQKNKTVYITRTRTTRRRENRDRDKRGKKTQKRTSEKSVVDNKMILNSLTI